MTEGDFAQEQCSSLKTPGKWGGNPLFCRLPPPLQLTGGLSLNLHVGQRAESWSVQTSGPRS